WSSRASVRSLPPFLFLLFRLLPTSLLFPYTTLFRSDFIAKLAQGHADDLLSTLCLARNCPLLVAPTMNVQMWTNPATQRNVAQLKADGIEMLGPGSGGQACGEVGDGRMIEPEEILAGLIAWAQPKLLAGKRVLLTAGPACEAIDPVRGRANLRSGDM